MKFIALMLEVISGSIEDRFKRDLRDMRGTKYLIPKDVYYTMLKDVKVASQNQNTKNRPFLNAVIKLVLQLVLIF